MEHSTSRLKEGESDNRKSVPLVRTKKKLSKGGRTREWLGLIHSPGTGCLQRRTLVFGINFGGRTNSDSTQGETSRIMVCFGRLLGRGQRKGTENWGYFYKLSRTTREGEGGA